MRIRAASSLAACFIAGRIFLFSSRKRAVILKSPQFLFQETFQSLSLLSHTNDF